MSSPKPIKSRRTSAPMGAREHSLASSYHEPMMVGVGATMGGLAPVLGAGEGVSGMETTQLALNEERTLLRDNNIISTTEAGIPQDTTANASSERTPLLNAAGQPDVGEDDKGIISQKWEDAVMEGKIKTTWQREAKVLAGYSVPLAATFLLQQSLTMASIFSIGHLGTTELGAVSLASMTAMITGFAVYGGLATSLDTLCAQAYGSGNKQLVGLQVQRMTYFLWLITIPIAVIWLLADRILMTIVPEPRVAELSGLYLKVLLAGMPGIAAFESGKRFVQAQGLFSASLYVLLFCAPLNAFMNWFLVWKAGLGFVGAPLAVAITCNLMPIGLFIYVRFFSKNGMQCWGGFSWRGLQNWGSMARLSLPGLVMIEAEVLAFECITLGASQLGVEALAAQSILGTLCSLTFGLVLPISIAASTRVANLVGATLVDAARTTTRVAFVAGTIGGTFNVILLVALSDYLPRLFTSDPDVIALVAKTAPICAAFQLFDALAAICNGILRGLGRQHVGGWVQLICYYGVAMPISFGTGFGLGWRLSGLWSGVAVALALVTMIEMIYLYTTDWDSSVEEAQKRNAEV